MRHDSALNQAVVHRQPELVALLLLHGADVNIPGRYDSTSLHWAARRRFVMENFSPASAVLGAMLIVSPAPAARINAF